MADSKPNAILHPDRMNVALKKAEYAIRGRYVPIHTVYARKPRGSLSYLFLQLVPGGT
jgi:hypothetical protein